MPQVPGAGAEETTIPKGLVRVVAQPGAVREVRRIVKLRKKARACAEMDLEKSGTGARAAATEGRNRAPPSTSGGRGP